MIVINSIFTSIPSFFSWLSNVGGLDIFGFIVSAFVFSVIVGIVIPWYNDND